MSYLKRKRLFSKNLFKAILVVPLMLVPVVAQAVIVTPDLEVITIPNVGASFQIINLQNTYSGAIPICTYNLPAAGSIPATVRIQNITSNSFEVKIQKAASSGTETAGDVHCMISEAGEFTVGGMHWEAGSHTPNVTSGRSNYGVKAADTVTPVATFTTPVVLHQVISNNDTRWSASWTYSNSSGNPPTAANIHVGKQIAGDTDTVRADEAIGYIIAETGSGAENGVNYKLALGADTILGVDNGVRNYALGTAYRHGIASQNAMDGGDGGWAVMLGATPLAGNQIGLAVDEDTIGDGERAHTTEQVAYWVFEPFNVADLDVSIDDGSATYTPGTASAYTITVTNNGPNDASTVNIVNNAPTGTSITSWSCAGTSCPAANGVGNINETATTLINGDILVYTVNVAVPANQTGNVVNSVSVSNNNIDPVSANDTASDTDTQLSSADIAVSNDDGSASYAPGTTVQYTLTVSNSGPSDASAVNVINNAPASTSISNWTCVGASCPNANGTGNINETIASLAASVSVTYTVDIAVPSNFTGSLANTASASAAEADPAAGNNSAVDTDTQSSSADIAVTNSDGVTAYLPGTTVVYNVTVSNNGPSDATSVLVTDAAPAGTTISAWSCSGASCPNVAGTGSISETVLTLVASDSVSYVVNVSVPFSFVGNLVNTASASATETDPNNTNNSVTDIDISSPDSDGDGVPDIIEITDGTDPNDPNDFKDSDGDGVPDLIEAAEGTDPNDPLSILDSDGDKVSDYIERGGDKDSDGIGDEFESSVTDTDGNNIKDDLDTDADGDGATDSAEGITDTDGDGIPDFLDAITGGNPQGGDSDADGIVDATECVAYPACADSDGDSIPNYADNDDDNDSLLTSAELGAGGGINPDDSDGDSVFDYLEPNNIDTDADTTFNHLDADDDGDSLSTFDELDANNDFIGDALNPDDLDNEGIPDYLDADNGDGSGSDIIGSGDSDNDGMSDAQECPAAPMCADSDGDGIPNYMISNTDSDGDGILDGVEIGTDPANPIDSDSDSVPDYLEDNTLDTDSDGVTNNLDADDDGDNIPTSQEIGAGGALNPADSDGDGIPDYLSVTTIQTGLDGGAGAINPLHFIVMLLITIINRQYTCSVKQQKHSL
ncbi:MAG: DUF11 domain-containing protein [Proteobacteria bacterium]|nr:DUF11 domain-containing protein [Pseudomonadota bacterium]